MRAGGTIHRLERYLVLPNGTASAWIATLGAAGCVAVAYFLAARLGLALRPEPAHMAVFWPASGIAAGILIIAGQRAGLAVGMGVMVGSIVAIVLKQRGLLHSALLGGCNFGEVVLLSWLLSRWIGGPFAFRDLRGVVGFLRQPGLQPRSAALAVPRSWPLPGGRIRWLGRRGCRHISLESWSSHRSCSS